MDGVGRLAAGVAHDFNNLLTVIVGYTELALEALGADDAVAGDVREIRTAADRAGQLSKQLLAFSRKQPPQPQVIDLTAIVGEVESMLRRVLGEDITLTVITPTRIGHVYAGPGQVEQVLMNLAVNARDAMPEGGSLAFELSDVEVAAIPAGVTTTSAPGAYVVLAVTDTGIGMDAATQARIFEPFFTTKAAAQGTGLGLSTVLGIVQQNGGFVQVSSALGEGSTFRVYLPRTDRRHDKTSTIPPPAVRRGTEMILVVEDEDQVRIVIAAILRRNGYRVLESSNGGEAFLISKDFDGVIDLLLTDVVMPRLTGRKLADELAMQRPRMKILFASGYSDDTVLRPGTLDPKIEFISKPFTPDALLIRVREVLDRPA
jgi:CheY-like chemotaxis protein